MRLLGEMAIWIALLMAAWAFTVFVLGTARGRADLIASGDRAVHAVLAMTAIASAALVAGLVGHDFTIRYVAVYTSLNLPRQYALSAFWSGAHGSLLFTILTLAVATTVVLFASGTRRRGRFELVGLALLLTVLLAIQCIALNPLSRLDWVPVDGIGMHPRLQNAGAALFPPLLYVAYACYSVPGVMAAAGAMRRKIGSDTLDSIVRWTTVGWVFNTLGLMGGIWWAYHEPERAAAWLSFPLENGSIFPWVASSGFLAVSLIQLRHAEVAGWTTSLVIAAFLFTIPAWVLTVPTNAIDRGAIARSPFFIVLGVGIITVITVTTFLVRRRLRNIKGKPRSGRLYAVAIVGAAAAMISAPVAGSRLRIERTVSISASQSAEVTGSSRATWSFASQGLSSYNALNRQVIALALDVHRNGEPVGLLSTETRQYVDVQGAPVFQPSSEPGIRSSMREDLYVVLGEIAEDHSATLRVSFNPLMVWLWIGGALLPIGGAMLTWPSLKLPSADP